jgi:hypothetical protein
LYVVAYLITFAWSAIINILNSRRIQDQYEHAGRVHLPLLVLQSIFLPSEGLFNAMVFFRPRFMATRNKYPKQTRIWHLRRSIYGERIKPSLERELEEGVVEMKEGVERDPSSLIPHGLVANDDPASAAQESERYFSSGRPAN